MIKLLPKIIITLFVVLQFYFSPASVLAQTVTFAPATNVSNSSGRSVNPVVAYDSNGKVHVAWAEWVDAKSNILYTNNVSGNFSSPVIIANDGNQKGAYMIGIAVQGNTLHLLYGNQTNDIQYESLTLTNGTPALSTKAKMTSGSEDGHNPSLIVDSTNRIHAVWIEKRNSPVYQVIHKIWSDGSGWEANDRIVNHSRTYQATPSLAATTDGKVHVVYEHGGGKDGVMGYSVYSGGSWQNGANPPSLSGSVNKTVLTSDGTNLYLLWSISQDTHNVYFSAYRNSTWSSPVKVSENWSDFPAISYSTKDSKAYAMWATGGSGPESIAVRTVDASGATGNIAELGRGANSKETRIAAGSEGVFAVWQTGSGGSEEIMLASSLLTQATPPPANSDPEDGTWVPDPEVTFVGKTAARSSAFLDWALSKYSWMEVGAGEQNPLSVFWVTIRNIVYALFVLFVLVTAFIIIITRGKSLSVKRFIPRFLGVILLVTFSFAIIQLIYQVSDIVQGFFLRSPDNPAETISSKHLLFIGFDYESFTGFRLTGSQFEESAFITLLLTKATAVTYYVMTSILIIRKIILWLLIVLSPVFPLLLLYYPIRNTAKLWIGEFFRWLLYAPLFSILLGGLVSVWRIGIPLPFNFTEAGKIPGQDKIYETSVNILLGGPGQQIGIDNSVNLPSTFALYVVALIMLWVVTILPFILLQIFLDYFHAYSFSENTWVKQLVTRGGFMTKFPPSLPPMAPVPSIPSSGGIARSIPISTSVNNMSYQTNTNSNAVRSSTETSWQRSAPVRENISTFSSRPIQTSNDILRLSNLTLPTMRDIAKFEIGSTSSNTVMQTDVTRMRESLQHIANPTLLTAPAERNKYTTVRQTLMSQSQTSPLAASLLSAVNSLDGQITTLNKEVVGMKRLLERLNNPSVVTKPVEREQYRQMKETLMTESQKGNNFANIILQTAAAPQQDDQVKVLKQELVQAKEKNDTLAHSLSALLSQVDREVAVESTQRANGFPVVNRVQSVSLEDYEAVKKMWIDNYRAMANEESNLGSASHDVKIKTDMEEIARTVNLLTSSEPEKVAEGMQTVANILPFLLLGGFSQTEIIAYLKAKLEAAKTVLEEIQKKQENDDTLLAAKKQEKPQEMHMEQAVTEPLKLSDDGKQK